MSRIVEVNIKARLVVPDGLETRHLSVDKNMPIPLRHIVVAIIDGQARSSGITRLDPTVLTIQSVLTDERSIEP